MLYRNAETIPTPLRERSGIELVHGDVLNPADVQRTLEGTDYATVVLGTRNNLEPTTAMSTGMNNIIAGMKTAGLRRVSVCLSSFLTWPAEKVPPMMKNINAEHQAMLEATEKSGLDYVAVIPPHIANEPGGDATVEHGRSPGRVVSKFDLAAFLVDSLEQSEHWGKMCGIARKA